MCRNSIIHTSFNILVTVEEFVYIYHLIDVNRYDYLNNNEPKQINDAMRQIMSLKGTQKGVVRILPNAEHKC